MQPLKKQQKTFYVFYLNKKTNLMSHSMWNSFSISVYFLYIAYIIFDSTVASQIEVKYASYVLTIQ